MMMESPVGTTYELWSPSVYPHVGPTRPILAVNCRPQSPRVKGPVSEDSAAGTD